MADPVLELIHGTTDPASAAGGIDPLALINPQGDEPPARAPVNPSYQAGQNAPGAVRGLASVLNGPAFGFADEIGGAVGGAYDYLKNNNPLGDKVSSVGLSGLVTGQKSKALSDYYAENRDYLRGAQDQEKETNPWTTAVTQGMASAPLYAVKMGKALEYLPNAVKPVVDFLAGNSNSSSKVMNVVQQATRGAAQAGATGAISGAGNSTANDLSGVLGDAGESGLWSAALGGGSVPVMNGIGAVGGNIGSRVNQKVADYFANQKIAEALVRDGRGTVVQSGASNPVNQVAARLRMMGDPAVIADASGANTRQLLDTLAVLPGQTKDAAANLLRQRQAGSAGRLIDSAEQNLGTNGARLAPTVNELIQQRASDAKPFYEALGQMRVQSPSFSLVSAVKAADSLGATKLGRQIATAEQVPFSLDVSNPANWGARDIDHVKQGLDTMIAKQFDPTTGRLTPLGVSYSNLKDKLVGELDRATTDPHTGQSLYQAARNAYAGPSALIDAANAGRSSMSQNADAITARVSSMSPSEQDAFRVGAFESLRNKLGNSQGGRTEVVNMWQNPGMQEKLKAIFGDERSFRQFATTTATEGRLNMLNRTGQGSQTAARQYGAGDLDAEAVKEAGGAVANAAAGNTLGALNGFKNTWNRVQTPEAVRNQMGQLLLSGGNAGQQNLGRLADLTQMMNQNAAIRARALGTALGTSSGSLIPGLHQNPNFVGIHNPNQ